MTLAGLDIIKSVLSNVLRAQVDRRHVIETEDPVLETFLYVQLARSLHNVVVHAGPYIVPAEPMALHGQVRGR